MHRTSSAATSLPKMASAAPMLHQRLREKMGEWETNFKFPLLFTVFGNKLDILVIGRLNMQIKLQDNRRSKHQVLFRHKLLSINLRMARL